MLRELVRDGRLPRVLLAFAAFCVVEYAAWIAVILYAYDQGGAALAGLVGVAQLVPAALLAPALGSFGDRLPRGAALSGTYAAEAVFLGGTALLLWSGAPVAAVVVGSALATTAVSVARPIHYASLPQLAPTPGALVTANSASGVLDGIGLFAGPVAAGLIAESAGPWLVLALSAGAMLVAAALTVRLHLPVASGEGGDGALSEAVAGLAQVRGDLGVLALLIVLGMSFVVVGSIEILSVSFSDVVLDGGDSSAGLLVGSAGIGGLVGAALAAGLAFRARLAPAVALGLLAAGVPLGLVAAVGTLPPAVVLLALCGLGQAVSTVAARTLLQRGTDDRILARVFAVQEAVMLTGLALGAVLAPLLIGWFGAAGGFVPLGLGLLASALLAWPFMRSLDVRAVFRPDVLATLRKVSFVAAMSPPALDRLSQAAEWTDVVAGVVVISQGDAGDAFYVVDRGRFSVTVDGVRREHTLGAGAGFGEIALLRGVARTATVTAVESSRVLRVEREDFLAAITGSADGRVIADRVALAHLARDSDSDTDTDTSRDRAG